MATITKEKAAELTAKFGANEKDTGNVRPRSFHDGCKAQEPSQVLRRKGHYRSACFG